MRDYVTVQQLLDLMNQRLAESEDCADCRFTKPVHRYQEPDEFGCNWSDSGSLRCSGRPAELCASSAAATLLWARDRYNVLSREGTIEDLLFESGGHRFECRVQSAGVASIELQGQPAVPDNAGWWIRVDGDPPRRAFDASLDDRDPRLLRRRILEWHTMRG